jgi:hypothetical protein
MPVTSLLIKPKDKKESNALDAKLKACKTAIEIKFIIRTFVST